MKLFTRKRKDLDRADSELVSLLFLLPLVLGILFTMIDTSIFYANRAQMISAARDGARTVGIMGGDGSATQGTPIEVRYGASRSSLCGTLNSKPVVANAYNPSTTSNIECAVLKNIAENGTLVNIKVASVTCDPQRSSSIAQRTSCAIRWDYNSIPGSGLGFIQRSNSENGKAAGVGGANLVIGTSETEVDLTGIAMRPRT